jgi:hypothetical protein
MPQMVSAGEKTKVVAVTQNQGSYEGMKRTLIVTVCSCSSVQHRFGRHLVSGAQNCDAVSSIFIVTSNKPLHLYNLSCSVTHQSINKEF